MMIKTKGIYTNLVTGKLTAASKYCQDLPVWEKFEKFAKIDKNDVQSFVNV